ncbi:profilin, required for normal timing of actin polymerization in response to thermal stress [Tulasnella sp. UAMH 9824]|nr:profilin, required for normal timing of actin polymerization in response to thermal stress [Tulasnella sp. UAMH 9824]
MSWQTYVDSNLVGTGKVSQAAILGQQGGVWASSPGFTLSQPEQNAVVGAWNNLDGVQASGVTLAGTKYFTLQADPDHIYGKKSANGCVIVKTTQAILVCVYKDPIQQQEAVSVVEALGVYLKSVGY